MDMAELFNKEDVYYLFRLPMYCNERLIKERSKPEVQKTGVYTIKIPLSYTWTKLSVKAESKEDAMEVFIDWLHNDRTGIDLNDTEFYQKDMSKLHSKKSFKYNYKFMTYTESFDYIESQRNNTISIMPLPEFRVPDNPSKIYEKGNSLIIAYYPYAFLDERKLEEIKEYLTKMQPVVKDIPSLFFVDYLDKLIKS